MKSLLLTFLAFFSVACSNTKKDSWHIINQKIQNSPVFYNQQMRKLKIEKKQNFFSEDEILSKKTENFLHLYKYLKSNDTVKINLVEIKSGKMYQFVILNSEGSEAKLLSFEEIRTKIEENEGTRLYYRVLDSHDKNK